ncbi:MAG: AhpC/TSA family protein [Halobacteriovoraceae bacterium]|nr:AhpC/TSA family protein [Halobacteriovoraceae bacterium]MCB9095453.1 AhpC/TSA family protein [Halobacteriovoraceae bacterium]
MKKIAILCLSVLLLASAQAKTLAEQIKEKKSRSAGKTPQEVKEAFSKAIEDLRQTGIERTSLQEGVKVPDFSLREKPISDYYKKGPVILKFYRGGWCPYCMLELKEYEKKYPKIKKAGGELIALSPETFKEVLKTKNKHNFTFPMFSDENNEIAKKFGIAFKLDKKVLELYQQFGIDLKENQNNAEEMLPIPGTYIVDKEGVIVYAFADADYTKRAEPSEILKILKNLKK